MAASDAADNAATGNATAIAKRAINERNENRTTWLLAEYDPRMLRERVKNKKAESLVAICLSTP